jgi:hypothetical protein
VKAITTRRIELLAAYVKDCSLSFVRDIPPLVKWCSCQSELSFRPSLGASLFRMETPSSLTSSIDSIVADAGLVVTPVDCSGLAARLVASVLRQRVVDAEKTVVALKLVDIRVSVSAHGPRGTPADQLSASSSIGTDEVLVRPRILPAVKSSLTTGSTRPHNGYHLFKSGEIMLPITFPLH